MKTRKQGERFGDPNGPTRRTIYKPESKTEIRQVPPGEWLEYLEQQCRAALADLSETEITRIAHGRTDTPIDSDTGYAARILKAIQSARDCAERGNISDALDWALMAGNLAGESRFADWLTRSKRTDPYKHEREKAVETAREIWANDETKDCDKEYVIRVCQDELKRAGLKQPSDRVLWTTWITKAGIVPDYANRPGRKRK